MIRDIDGYAMKTRWWVSRLLTLVWVLAGACLAGAQSREAAAPVVLRMETVNRHFVVELEDRSLGKLRLLVDTGAETTLLSRLAAAKAKVSHHFIDRFYSFYGFGQGRKARLAGHTKLELGSGARTLATVDAFVVDAANLSVGVEPAPDGILGWDFFRRVCARLDARGQRMTIGSAEHCAPTEEGFYAPPVKWMKEGLLLPVTVTLGDRRALKLKLEVDTGSDSIVLSPRLRGKLGLEKYPQGKADGQGAGMNGTYPWDLVFAASVEGVGGHPMLGGKIPMLVPRAGGYSQPFWLFSGKNEALLTHDGVLGTSMWSYFELIFDPVEKKLYERANSFVVKKATE